MLISGGRCTKLECTDIHCVTLNLIPTDITTEEAEDPLEEPQPFMDEAVAACDIIAVKRTNDDLIHSKTTSESSSKKKPRNSSARVFEPD